MTSRIKSSHLRITIGLISLLVITATCSSEKEHSPEDREVAVSDANHLSIDFRATDLDEKTFDALSLKGNIVLLDFWAVWCAPCIAAFPVLNQLNNDLQEKGFQVVGIAVYSGTAEDVRNFITEHELNYTVVIGDDDLVERFDVIGYPTYFLIDPDGNVYKQYVGEVRDLYKTITNDVLELQEEIKSAA